MHDHEVRHISEIDRRSLLIGASVSIGAMVLEGLGIGVAHASTSYKLPGFDAFASSVKVFKNSKYYLVESNGLPNHAMMVGIKSWQQQVPTPQPYVGSNAWSIPISPKLSTNPISGQGHFLRGAIAIAVNGVPIFNALNNRGEDAFLAGELDDLGGHCGRADDYHYHVAPFHLQSIVGPKAPIAYALDGFPIYGEKEVDGKAVAKLDNFNGHFDSKKKYHYHGTKTFPYINGGFRGVVAEVEGQVSPQPTTRAFRPAGEPLRDATIKSFERTGSNSYDLTYELKGETYEIKYEATVSQVIMEFISPTGDVRREVYKRS